ncbi:hypothetical protein ACFQY4_19145 [Catellatospora bangladeshensis]|uniref:Uncharacterized protein n=1 Tax=Catellatospora bangladeshensis TaxID=310355 RepID=A0A8J3JPZ9_9ACTN|nr:hypothetical protein [Catellatospora bangladeshensis]GIF84593.1 hypothetical protein Cba03nite_59420 [Catellatospora bangladeshensis]
MHLLLIHVIRAWLDTGWDAVGVSWLRGLHDPVTARALASLHAYPGNGAVGLESPQARSDLGEVGAAEALLVRGDRSFDGVPREELVERQQRVAVTACGGTGEDLVTGDHDPMLSERADTPRGREAPDIYSGSVDEPGAKTLELLPFPRHCRRQRTAAVRVRPASRLRSGKHQVRTRRMPDTAFDMAAWSTIGNIKPSPARSL